MRRAIHMNRKQKGAALFVVLVMLLVLAWIGMSGFRMSGQHLMIVGNSQAREHAVAAAQRAIEQTISSDMFARDPGAVAAASRRSVTAVGIREAARYRPSGSMSRLRVR